MSEKNPKASIIVLAFDNPDFFIRAIESLEENTFYDNFEVIAVHNPCGNEQTNSKIREACEIFFMNHDNFKYRINEKNLYHGPGIMRGVEISDSKSKYCILSNDDIFIPAYQNKYLEKMVNFIEADNDVATVTPSLYYPKETVYWIGKQDPEQPQHDFLHIPKGDPRLPNEPLKTCYNNMAFCLTRKSLLIEIPIGQSCPMYGSDSEFANRIKDKYPQMTHWVLPEVKLYHYNIYFLRTNRDDPVTKG